MLPSSLRGPAFGGNLGATVEPGRELLSDPVPLRVGALDSLTTTMYSAEPTGPVGSARWRARPVAGPAGTTTPTPGPPRSTRSQRRYVASGVEVSGPALLPHRSGVVAFGDSITDGAFSTADASNRYPDELAELLAAWREPVLDAGIGGNGVLNDSRCAGEDAVARFRRDALGQPDVGSVITLARVEDIGLSEVDRVCAYPPPRSPPSSWSRGIAS